MDDQVQEVEEVPAESVYVEIGETNPVTVEEEHHQSEVHHVQEEVVTSQAQEEQVPVVYRGYPQEIVHMIQGTQAITSVHTDGVVDSGDGEEGEVMMIIIDEGHLDPATGLIEHVSGASNINGGSVIQSYQTTEAGDAVGQAHVAAQTDNVELHKKENMDSEMLYCAEEDITEDNLDHKETASEDIDNVIDNVKGGTGDIVAKSLQCSGVDLAENAASENELLDEKDSGEIVGTSPEEIISGKSEIKSSATSIESDGLSINPTVKESKTKDSTKSDSLGKIDIDMTKDDISSKDERKSSSEKPSESNDATKFPFVCGLCSEKYADLGLYYDHFKTHAESEKFLNSCKKHEVLEALSDSPHSNGNKEQSKQNVVVDESETVDSSDDVTDQTSKRKSRIGTSRKKQDIKAKIDSLDIEEENKISTRQYGTRGTVKSSNTTPVKVTTKNKNKIAVDPKSPTTEHGEKPTAEDEKIEKGIRTRSSRGNIAESQLSPPVHKGRKAKASDEVATSSQNTSTEVNNQETLYVSDDDLPGRRTRKQLKRANSNQDEQRESKKVKKEPTEEPNSAKTVSASRTRKGKQSMTPSNKDVPNEKDSEPPVSSYRTRTGRMISTPSKFDDSSERKTGREHKTKIKVEVEEEVETMNETKEPKRRGRKPKSQNKTDIDSLKGSQLHDEGSGTADIKHRYGTRRSLGVVKMQRVDDDFKYEHPYFTKVSKSATPDTTPKKDWKKGNESDKRLPVSESKETRRGRSKISNTEKDNDQQQSDNDMDTSDSLADKHLSEADKTRKKESGEEISSEDNVHDMDTADSEPVKDTGDQLKTTVKDKTCTDEEAENTMNESVDSEVGNEVDTDDKHSPDEDSEYNLSIDQKADTKKRGKYSRRKKKKGPRLYTCEVCGKEMCKKGLKRHLTVHSNSRNYVCGDCGRSYKCQNHLTDHKHRHCKKVKSTRPYIRRIKLEEVEFDELFADVLDVKTALKYVINKKVADADEMNTDEDAEDIKKEDGADLESGKESNNAEENVEDPDNAEESVEDPGTKDVVILKTETVEVDATEVLEQDENTSMDGYVVMENDSEVEKNDVGKPSENKGTVPDECESEKNNAINASKQQSDESGIDANMKENNSEDPTTSSKNLELDDDVNQKMIQAAAEILHSIRNNGEKLEAPDSDVEEIQLQTGPEHESEMTKELELNEKGVSQMFTGTTKYVQCRKCEKILPRRLMPKHRISHLKSRDFKCEICTKSYKCKAHLKDHVRSVHTENTTECKLCLKVLRSEKALEYHMLVHLRKGETSDVNLDHDYEQKKTDGIEDDTDGKSELEDDSKDGEDEKFPCKLCGKRFKKYVLQRHMLVHQMNKDHICDICQATFKSKEQLLDHKKGVHVEGNKFLCNICNSTYKTSKTLWMHKNNHLQKDNPYYSEEVVQKLQEEAGGKRKYGAPKVVKCEVCGKDVLAKRMVRHMTTHKNTRDYSCSVCKKTFVALRYVKDHILKVHRATKCMCEICGQYFKGKQYVEKHRQTHGPRDKQCPLCDKAFTTEFYLKTHLQTHAEYKKAWNCPHCDAVFSHKPRLDIHILEHHNEREPDRPCKYCGVCFLSRQKARMHERKVHEGFKEGTNRIRKHSRSVKRPQVMGMDLDGATTVMIKQEDLTQGQEVYVQDGTFLQVSDATGEETEQIEQVLEIPANAEQCQILLYPDGSFKVLNMTDPDTQVIEAE